MIDPTISSRRPLALVTLLAFAAGLAAADPAAKQRGPKVGDEAKDFELTALGGETVKLSAQAKAGPVVLVVLRGYPGYQCPLCSKQVAEFRGKADAIKTAGAHVVFVYPGPAEGLKARAAEFVKGKDYPAHFTFVLDPDYAVTTAYGLRWDAKNETAYPATFVLDEKRTVRLAKVSATHGDRAKVEDVLQALGSK